MPDDPDPQEQPPISTDKNDNDNPNNKSSPKLATKAEPSMERETGLNKRSQSITGRHPNNSARLEHSIQNFLSTKTAVASLSGVTYLTYRDKIRLLLQPFIVTNQEANNQSSLIVDGSRDILDAFSEATPHSTNDRHRRYTSDMSSSQHADIQNCCELESYITSRHVQTRVSLLSPMLIRPPIDPNVTFTQLRLNQNKAWADSSIAQGTEFQQRGDLERALKLFNHALEIDNECVNAYLSIGSLHCDGGDFDKAIAALEKVLSMDALNEQAFQLLEKTIHKSGRREYFRSKFFQNLLLQRRFYDNKNSQDLRQFENHPNRQSQRDLPITPHRSSLVDLTTSELERGNHRDSTGQSEYSNDQSRRDNSSKRGRSLERSETGRAVYRRSPRGNRREDYRDDFRHQHQHRNRDDYRPYRHQDRRSRSRSREGRDDRGNRRNYESYRRDHRDRDENRSRSKQRARLYRRPPSPSDDDDDGRVETEKQRPEQPEIEYD